MRETVKALGVVMGLVCILLGIVLVMNAPDLLHFVKGLFMFYIGTRAQKTGGTA